MLDSVRKGAGTGRLRRSWAWVVADGVLGVVVGVLALAWPRVTVLALAIVLGVGLLLQGAFELSAASRVASGTRGRGWLIFFAVLAIVAGLICLLQPGAGLFAIALGVTIWFFVAGINELVAAFTYAEHRVWNLIAGVVSVIAGVILIADPGIALSTIALLTGVLFIVRGLTEIGMGAQLRRLESSKVGH